MVVPTRNRWARIERTLRCALGQRDVDHGVIVVDDGSTDAGALTQLLARIADDRLSGIRLPASGGSAAARNAGLAVATGEWAAFLDDDDLWAPTKLRGQLDVAAAGGASLVYSGVLNVDDDARLIHAFPPPDAGDLAARLLTMNAIPAGASNVMVRRSLMAEAGGFDTAFAHLADWDAWIRLAAAAPAAADGGFPVAYVQHRGTRGGSDAAGVERDLELLKAKHAGRLTVDERWFARWHAGALLRAGSRRSAARLYATTALRHRDPECLARAAYAVLGPPRRPGRRARAPEWVATAAASPPLR